MGNYFAIGDQKLNLQIVEETPHFHSFVLLVLHSEAGENGIWEFHELTFVEDKVADPQNAATDINKNIMFWILEFFDDIELQRESMIKITSLHRSNSCVLDSFCFRGHIGTVVFLVNLQFLLWIYHE